MKTGFSIGELARLSGCKVQTVRYYEQIGLLPLPLRTSGNHRVYGADQASRLAFIVNARGLGFPLDSIRALLDLGADPSEPCERINQIAAAHLEDVEARLDRLSALKAELERVIGQCAGGQVADCRIVQALSDAGIADAARLDAAEEPK